MVSGGNSGCEAVMQRNAAIGIPPIDTTLRRVGWEVRFLWVAFVSLLFVYERSIDHTRGHSPKKARRVGELTPTGAILGGRDLLGLSSHHANHALVFVFVVFYVFLCL